MGDQNVITLRILLFRDRLLDTTSACFVVLVGSWLDRRAPCSRVPPFLLL
jgi:hypothetical protein